MLVLERKTLHEVDRFPTAHPGLQRVHSTAVKAMSKRKAAPVSI
jgi:hypothetical protein